MCHLNIDKIKDKELISKFYGMYLTWQLSGINQYTKILQVKIVENAICVEGLESGH